MENNENKIFGKIFDSVELISEEHLDLILQNMDKESSLFFMVEAIKMAYSRQIYSIGEVEVLSKAIRVINKQ
jgi:hypothetical protein